MIFDLVIGSCKETIGFNLDTLKTIDSAKNITSVASVFIVAEEDKLVSPENVNDMFDLYKGPKYFLKIRELPPT